MEYAYIHEYYGNHTHTLWKCSYGYKYIETQWMNAAWVLQYTAVDWHELKGIYHWKGFLQIAHVFLQCATIVIVHLHTHIHTSPSPYVCIHLNLLEHTHAHCHILTIEKLENTKNPQSPNALDAVLNTVYSYINSQNITSVYITSRLYSVKFVNLQRKID